MPASFCPNFDMRCRTCGATAIALIRDPLVAAYRLACQSCHTSNVVCYDLCQPVSGPPPCVRHPGGWCPVASSGYCALYCPSARATAAP